MCKKELTEAKEENIKLKEILEELIDMYIANRGTSSEFISCITPPNFSDMTILQRRKNKCWSTWDKARRAVGKQLILNESEEE